LVGQLSQRQAALEDALSKEVSWDATLDDLARVLPKDVWLTSLSAQSPTPAGVATVAPTPAATTTGSTTTTSTAATTTTTAAPVPAATTPTAFTISGFAGSQDSVAELLARLRLMPMLNNVTLGNTTTRAPAVAGGKSFVQFQVSANIQSIPNGAGL
jgi:Tfp pilus assembly protein PilN